MIKTALTIAGSDCSGGAGVQADIKTMSALGVYAMSVITSVVAENTSEVLLAETILPNVIEAQLDAIFSDIGADAVKIGMLPTEEVICAVAKKLKTYRPRHIIVDPVMCAKDGNFLMHKTALSAFVEHIIPIATMLTPNIPEAETLTGLHIRSKDDMKTAAKRIFDMGAGSVLVKGGHSDGDPCDILYDGSEFYSFSEERIDTKNTHGTGCTLSSAVASFSALGYSPVEAVANAKKYITGAIKNALPIGKGHGPLNHFYGRRVKRTIDYSLYLCTDRTICPDIVRGVCEAIEGGVTVVQLREKNCSSREFSEIGQKLREVTAQKNIPLIVNDRFDIAECIGADGVHLGQSDLPCSAVRRIVGDGMVIGVTAHNVTEAINAERDGADYIGVGAMFATSTKGDAKVIAPGELDAILKAVKIPVVLIGGINKSNVSRLAGKGDGIAVVSAILDAPDITIAARELKTLRKSR